MEEIHLSMNNYDVIDLDDDEHCHPIQVSSVKRLHFTGIILNLPIRSQLIFIISIQYFLYILNDVILCICLKETPYLRGLKCVN